MPKHPPLADDEIFICNTNNTEMWLQFKTVRFDDAYDQHGDKLPYRYGIYSVIIKDSDRIQYENWKRSLFKKFIRKNHAKSKN